MGKRTNITNYNVDVTYFLDSHLHVCKMLNCSFNDLQNSAENHFLNYAGEH